VGDFPAEVLFLLHRGRGSSDSFLWPPFPRPLRFAARRKVAEERIRPLSPPPTFINAQSSLKAASSFSCKVGSGRYAEPLFGMAEWTSAFPFLVGNSTYLLRATIFLGPLDGS